jgi:hypothetical protein
MLVMLSGGIFGPKKVHTKRCSGNPRIRASERQTFATTSVMAEPMPFPVAPTNSSQTYQENHHDFKVLLIRFVIINDISKPQPQTQITHSFHFSPILVSVPL